MDKITRSALVPFSSKQMFELVDDVEKYHEFVPYCQASHIIERTEQSVSATLDVAKSGFTKSFSTKNMRKPYEKIYMQLLNGPFKHLEGLWTFHELSADACKIELEIEFEFSNKLTSLAFSGLFHQLIQSMVTAFTERAEKVYTKQ
ncbi:type II toxin-antitoxin system RatA family toxin [Aliikangiella sp. IMCC44653]